MRDSSRRTEPDRPRRRENPPLTRSIDRRSIYSLQDRQAQEEFRGSGRRQRREDEAGWNEEPPQARWAGRSRLRSDAGRLGPLTAATDILRRIVPGHRSDATNPHGVAHGRPEELNPRDRRSSFFDMDSEGPPPGEPQASYPSLEGSRGTPPPRAPQSFRPTRRAKRRRVPIIASVVVLLMVVGGVAYALGTGGDEKSPATTATPSVTSSAVATTTAPATSGAEKNVKLGVFRGTSASDVKSFSSWLGRDVDYAVDYSTRTSWDEIANPTYMLSSWRGSGYTMVYAVAMLPTRDSSATLASGAKGNYNAYFKKLAQNLVAYDQGDSIIRLGWEFNVSGWPWHPTSDQQDEFISYWRQIVKTMRSVPGAEDLKFDWNVNNGGDTYDSSIFYPGNKYVDYIGVDVYDTSWEDDTYPYPSKCDSDCRLQRQENAWSNTLDATYGLLFWSDFAESKGKPMSFPEWGLWDRPDGQGGADNPYFIEQMYDFIDNPQNNVAYQAYFEFDAGEKGNHMLEELSKGGKQYKKLFSK